MSGQVINIRGTISDCWYVNRFSSDDAQVSWSAGDDDWFDLLDTPWVVSYQAFAGPAWLPESTAHMVPHQFVLRRQPVVC